MLGLPPLARLRRAQGGRYRHSKRCQQPGQDSFPFSSFLFRFRPFLFGRMCRISGRFRHVARAMRSKRQNNIIVVCAMIAREAHQGLWAPSPSLSIIARSTVTGRSG